LLLQLYLLFITLLLLFLLLVLLLLLRREFSYTRCIVVTGITFAALVIGTAIAITIITATVLRFRLDGIGCRNKGAKGAAACTSALRH
jgi:hypothetical protein